MFSFMLTVLYMANTLVPMTPCAQLPSIDSLLTLKCQDCSNIADMNECENESICAVNGVPDAECVNVPGGFNCSCNQGYMRQERNDPNSLFNYTCIGELFLHVTQIGHSKQTICYS